MKRPNIFPNIFLKYLQNIYKLKKIVFINKYDLKKKN